MTKLIKAFPLLIATAAFTASAAAPEPSAADSASAPKPARRASDLFGDSVVAKGKGFEIKRSQLDDEVIRIKAQAAARGQNVSPDQVATLERQILDQMIQIQLLLGKATDADKAAGKEGAEKKIKDAQTQLGSEEAFSRRLKAEGLTREQLLEKWTEQSTAETIIKRELKATPTEADAKKYYDDNPSKFESPEMVRVSHILFSIKDPNDQNPNPALKKDLPDDQKKAKLKLAEDALKRAKAGEDFTKLAQELSEDPGVKQNKGEYKLSREDPFVPEFKAAAFSLNTNQVSDIVTTMFGYHILKLWEKIPAKKETYAGLDTKTIYLKGESQYITIREILSDQGLQKQLPEYFKQLKKDGGVEIVDAKLKAIELPEPPAPK